jgi:hypothetical protein
MKRFDGKFVVHCNDNTLTAENMALGAAPHSCPYRHHGPVAVA